MTMYNCQVGSSALNAYGPQKRAIIIDTTSSDTLKLVLKRVEWQ